RGLVFRAEPAPPRARPGARRDHRGGRLHPRRRAALRVRARAAPAPPVEAGRDVGDPRLAPLDGDGGRPRPPARRPWAGGRLRHGRGRLRKALGRRPELLLLPRRQPEDQPLATVMSRRGLARASASTVTGRRSASPRHEHRSVRTGSLARTVKRTPLALRLAVLAVLVLGALAAVNVAYQVGRKPTELLGLVFRPTPLTPDETWARYRSSFRANSTDLVRPELLAALAHAESHGDPIARTAWQW